MKATDMRELWYTLKEIYGYQKVGSGFVRRGPYISDVVDIVYIPSAENQVWLEEMEELYEDKYGDYEDE